MRVNDEATRTFSLRLITAVILPLFILLLTASAKSAGQEEWWSVESVMSEGVTSIKARRGFYGETRSYTIATSVKESDEAPSICVDGHGQAAAVWVRKGNRRERIMLSIFSNGSWSSPVNVNTSNDRFTSPSVSFAGKKSLWIAWSFYNGKDSNIAVLLWRKGSAAGYWTFGHERYPEISPAVTSAGDNGSALVWYGYDGRKYHPYRCFFNGSTWSDPQEITSTAGENGIPLSFFSVEDYRQEIVSFDGRKLLSLEGTQGIPTKALTSSGSLIQRGPAGQFVSGSDTVAGGAWTDGTNRWSGPLLLSDSNTGVSRPQTDALNVETLDAAPFDRSAIMCIGDSVTYGRGSSTDSPATGYPTRLETNMKGPWMVKNRGIPGDTSIGLLNRLDTELDRRSPGLTVLMIGVNDAFYGLDPAVVLFNIEEAADRILAKGGKILVATTTPVLPAIRPIQYNRLQTLNSMIADWTILAGYSLVNLWKAIQSRPNWKTKFMDPLSGNHLNDRGYGFIARKFRFKIFKENLLFGDMDWIALDHLQPGQLTEEDNTGTSIFIDDVYSSLAQDDISAVCALDIDGDGIDSLGIIQDQAGQQSLSIYTLPPAWTFDEAPLIGAVRQIAQGDWINNEKGRVTHLFGIDADGDGIDEIGLVRYRMRGRRQMLEIWKAHQQGIDPQERIVFDRWKMPRGKRIRDISSIQADQDPYEEILILAEKNLTGEQSIMIFDTPQAGADTRQENKTPLLYSNRSVGKRILQILGKDISDPPDGMDELIILRGSRKGNPDRLQAYSLPTLPRLEDAAKLQCLAYDKWIRSSGPHQFFIENLDLDNQAGGTISALGIWLNH